MKSETVYHLVKGEYEGKIDNVDVIREAPSDAKKIGFKAGEGDAYLIDVYLRDSGLRPVRKTVSGPNICRPHEVHMAYLNGI